jgi:hypothetical protein
MEQKQPTRLASLAVAAFFIVTVHGARAADECLEKPNAPSPQGSHWYYRTDRTSNRQCWYLGSERGKAGTLAREDTAPARPQPSKMSAPPAQTYPAQATAAVETATAEVMPAGLAPVEVTAGQGNTPDPNSTVTLSLPTPPNSSSVSVRDGYAEEKFAKAPREMGPTGPIVTPTQWSAAARALSSSFFTQFSALLAVVLGLAAIIGRMIFTLSAGRKPMPKSQSARGQLSAASTDEHVLEPFAHTAASTDELEPFTHTAASTDEHVLKPFADTAASTNEAGMAADWASSPPTDAVAGIESTLLQLLRELEQLRYERVCRGFEPTRKAVA